MTTRTDDFHILYTDEQDDDMSDTPGWGENENRRTERTVASIEAAGYDRRIEIIVDGLRRLADQIERDSKPYDRPSFDGTPAYANAASRTMHTLFWGIANLNAAALIDAAGRADRAAAEEAAEKAAVTESVDPDAWEIATAGIQEGNPTR